ncbi:MAG: sugar phosphate isomerase/epimerase [Acidobacteria bacterium]|nr:MAG: sugar phosphate isomerase/epimerase [Acidobacteriota bacterium]
MSRRTFGKLAAVGLVASAVPLHGSSKLDIGIGTYSYHNLTLDDMIAQLNALNISEIEMSRGEFMVMNHPGDDLFHAARTKLDRAGIRCVSYYSATIKDGQDLENALRFAKILGSQNVSGDATGNILTRIDQGCSQDGLTFGIHNHFFKGEKFAYENPEDVLRALAGLSNTVGATADVGHFASCGYDTVEAIRKLGSRLKLVHLKDVEASGGEVNVLLGKGISKIPEVMRELHRQNFAHLIAIEYEKEGDVNRDMKADVEFARKFA